MGRVNFVIGGTRSGKSSFALELANKPDKKIAFIATCPYCDEDMNARIQKHKDERPPEWDTYEEPKEVPELLRTLYSKYDVVLIDCMTLFVTNYLLDNDSEELIYSKTNEMMDVLKQAPFDSVIVSNEVGMGTHPEHSVTRKFRDIAGKVNQITAAKADEVYFMAAGISMKLKG